MYVIKHGQTRYDHFPGHFLLLPYKYKILYIATNLKMDLIKAFVPLVHVTHSINNHLPTGPLHGMSDKASAAEAVNLEMRYAKIKTIGKIKWRDIFQNRRDLWGYLDENLGIKYLIELHIMNRSHWFNSLVGLRKIC